MGGERTERVSFPGIQGTNLDGRLHLPTGRPKAYALFAHCFTCSKDSVAASRISRALADRGIAVLRFDFTGLGGSEGDFANTNFSSNVGDLVQAAGYLKENGEAPRVLVGHSLGGSAVLAAAAQIPEVEAVATIGAPSDPAHVAKLLGETLPEIESGEDVEVELGRRRFTIRKQFLKDIAEQNLTQIVHNFGKALLVMHSPSDITVSISHAQRIFEAARHPKSFITLDNADHLLMRKRDAAYVAEVLVAWASRYVSPVAMKEDAVGRETVSPGSVLVTETGTGKFTQQVRVGSHRFLADEPTSVGGDDAGPSPYDLLLAALGTCTAMTLRLYADRKKWPLERVGVVLHHDKIHADDCEACETQSGKIDRIAREIQLSGNLDEDQRKRLMEIADRCPVHRTLHSEILIETGLSS